MAWLAWNVVMSCRYWSAHPITDVAQFNRLLEAWPNTVSRMLEDGKFKSQLADCVSTLLALDQHGLVVKACVLAGGDWPHDRTAVTFWSLCACVFVRPTQLPCNSATRGFRSTGPPIVGGPASVRAVGGIMEDVPLPPCDGA